ncbi:MAG: transcriptional regulator [Spirochaetaceae bacterium]|nr:MAG: transcriptional regulator [Spirochaetaceae bacterium]
MDTAKIRTIASQREETLRDVSQKLKVCGHPVRLELLCAIAKEQEPCVSELWVCVRQPQPVVSQHLAVLKERGIVSSEVQGNRRIYSISDPYIRRLILSLKSEFGELARTDVDDELES